MGATLVPDLVIEGGGDVRCFRCSQFIGETEERIELVGIGRGKEFTDMIAKPKLTWRCKCGWVNVYKRK